MTNARGHYGTLRIGQIPGVYPDPYTFLVSPDYRRVVAPEPEYAKDGKIGTGGKIGLLATLGVIVAIGVVGTKRGIKWSA